MCVWGGGRGGQNGEGGRVGVGGGDCVESGHAFLLQGRYGAFPGDLLGLLFALLAMTIENADNRTPGSNAPKASRFASPCPGQKLPVPHPAILFGTFVCSPRSYLLFWFWFVFLFKLPRALSL